LHSHLVLFRTTPNKLISGLASACTDLLKKQCPERKQIKEKPTGYKLVPPKHTQLHNEARGRSNLRIGPLTPEDLGTAVTSWEEVCITAAKANIQVPTNLLLAPPVDSSTLDVQDRTRLVDFSFFNNNEFISNKSTRPLFKSGPNRSREGPRRGDKRPARRQKRVFPVG
jgi:hypothetical protein